jgi:hypothetical protein
MHQQSFADVLQRASTAKRIVPARGTSHQRRLLTRNDGARSHRELRAGKAAAGKSGAEVGGIKSRPAVAELEMAPAKDGPAAKLRRFKELLELDLISKADYERQKEMVLQEMGGATSGKKNVIVAAQERAKELSVTNVKNEVKNLKQVAVNAGGMSTGDAELDKRREHQRLEKEKVCRNFHVLLACKCAKSST